jgi:AcrR family transcriptional regulator
MADEPAGRRERKKAATRKAIADAAVSLFLEHGYHAVSVKQIAEAADVAVATVFAHFPDGKPALIFDEDASREASLVSVVRDRVPGQSVLDALEQAFLANYEARQQTEEFRAFTKLVEETPELALYFRTMWLRHERALAEAITAELGAAPDDIAITGLAHFILGALLLARDDPDPRQALTRLFSLLKTGWGPLCA